MAPCNTRRRGHHVLLPLLPPTPHHPTHQPPLPSLPTSPHRFWVEFVAWEGKVNNLAGIIGWFFVLVLWVTSLETVRRRMYQLFFRCHIICFLGFFLFSCAHYAQSYTYFVPGEPFVACWRVGLCWGMAGQQGQRDGVPGWTTFHGGGAPSAPAPLPAFTKLHPRRLTTDVALSTHLPQACCSMPRTWCCVPARFAT